MQNYGKLGESKIKTQRNEIIPTSKCGSNYNLASLTNFIRNGSLIITNGIICIYSANLQFLHRKDEAHMHQ